MNIISGKLKGRKIFAPGGLSLRPTPNKVREALFNILSNRVSGASFLDLYAGTGAVGIEALSRGATFAVFVEHDRRHRQFLNKNLMACGLNGQSAVFRSDATDFLKTTDQSFDLVFLDPPYAGEDIEKVLPRLNEGDIIAKNGCLIIEHFHKRALPEAFESIRFLKKYRYGETSLSFYGKS
ncbi:MAG: 16S rRNA (guanine(966)-N(2))-methyltransferase RsmD [Nitrospiria bacterium]